VCSSGTQPARNTWTSTAWPCALTTATRSTQPSSRPSLTSSRQWCVKNLLRGHFTRGFLHYSRSLAQFQSRTLSPAHLPYAHSTPHCVIRPTSQTHCQALELIDQFVIVPQQQKPPLPAICLPRRVHHRHSRQAEQAACRHLPWRPRHLPLPVIRDRGDRRSDSPRTAVHGAAQDHEQVGLHNRPIFPSEIYNVDQHAAIHTHHLGQWVVLDFYFLVVAIESSRSFSRDTFTSRSNSKRKHKQWTLSTLCHKARLDVDAFH
jgi:hypothetical protein